MSGLMQLKAVDMRFGRVCALSQVDLKIAAGQRVALIGANGSGKSTLLRLLHGLLRPSAGSVLRDRTMRQAMVFQRPFALRASALSNAPRNGKSGWRSAAAIIETMNSRGTVRAPRTRRAVDG